VTKVKVRKGESFDHALSRFISAINKDGVLKEIRLRERHIKDSQIRREKEKEKNRVIQRDRRKHK
jgi:ribosomal protein S21